MESHRFADNEEVVSGGISSGEHPRDLYDRLPFHAIWYVKQFGSSLCGRLFSAMSLAGDVPKIPDLCFGCLQDTAVGAWIMRLWHWREHKATDLVWHSPETDSPYVWCSRTSQLQAALKWNNTAVGDPSVLFWTKDPRQSIRGLLSKWPDSNLFSLTLLIAWPQFRVWHARLFLGCSPGLAQCGTFFRTPMDVASAIRCASVMVGACGILPLSQCSHFLRFVLLYERSCQRTPWPLHSMASRYHWIR